MQNVTALRSLRRLRATGRPKKKSWFEDQQYKNEASEPVRKPALPGNEEKTFERG
jgi:hypothetical protein